MTDYQRTLNLLITDDHLLITEGIATLLRSEKGIGEIYMARNGREAVDQALANDIECIIMDINMPVLNGLEATKMIKEQKPGIKVIAVSMFHDAAVVSKMMKAGADAFINKDTGKAELLKALEKVMAGEKYISPAISTNLITHLTDRTVQSHTPEKQLTPRELEIIGLIAGGFTNKEIADRLFLSAVTVNTHRKNILAKLHLKNTAALVKYAAEQKLL